MIFLSFSLSIYVYNIEYSTQQQGTFTKIKILLGHKDNLTNLRGSIQNVYSDHKEMKLEIKNRKQEKKSLNI